LILGIYFVEAPYARINMIDRDPIRQGGGDEKETYMGDG
jgi:hypothetical protein